MQRDYLSRAVEVSIHVGLVILLALACLLILFPFLPLIAWGIIIATTTYPIHLRLRKLLGGRNVLTSVLSTAVLLAIVIVPVFLLAGSLVHGIHSLAVQLREGTRIFPPLPETVKRWPIIGANLTKLWELGSKESHGRTHAQGPKDFLWTCLNENSPGKHRGPGSSRLAGSMRSCHWTQPKESLIFL